MARPGYQLFSTWSTIGRRFAPGQHRHHHHYFPDVRRGFSVLGIESSCDDSAIAVLNHHGTVLHHARLSQNKLHVEHGGIHPSVAYKAHLVNLPHLLSNIPIELKFDAVAVTRGPGLPGSLTVGISAAKAVAAMKRVPIYATHHMESHLLTCRIPDINLESMCCPQSASFMELNASTPEFPFLALLVSGGHTLLVLCHSLSRYTILGETLDDAVGEAFDKVARELALDWTTSSPGQLVENLAFSFQQQASKEQLEEAIQLLPVPLVKPEWKSQIKFSFAGLKSAVRRHVQSQQEFLKSFTEDEQRQWKGLICYAFQHTVAQHISQKLSLALQLSGCQDISRVVVSGGVASNKFIAQSIINTTAGYKKQVTIPKPDWCTDNAVMVAWSALERYNAGQLEGDGLGDWVQKPKWSLEDLNISGYTG